MTARIGLLTIDQLMDSLSFAEHIEQHFPLPKSNRGYRPSEFIKSLILMQHEGSFHLDDVRHIHDDEALRTVLGLKTLPRATTLGDWLRRMGNEPQIQDAWVKVNRAVRSLNRRLFEEVRNRMDRFYRIDSSKKTNLGVDSVLRDDF